MSRQEFLKLYRLTKEYTKGFTSFDPKLLLHEPRTLLVFRAILNVSRQRMGEILLGRNAKSAIEKYENGVKPIQRYKTAKKYMNRLYQVFLQRGLIGFDDEQLALRNFERLKDNAREIRSYYLYKQIAAKQAQISRKSIPPSEQRVIDLLESAGIRCYMPEEPPPKGLRCMIHGSLSIGYRHRFFDLVAPDDKRPKLAIEIRAVDLPKGDRFVHEIENIFRLLKKQYPAIKAVHVILGSTRPNDQPPAFIEIADAAFVDANLHELPEYVKQVLKS